MPTLIRFGFGGAAKGLRSCLYLSCCSGKINGYICDNIKKNEDTGRPYLLSWGVGNHGGASVPDLESINALQEQFDSLADRFCLLSKDEANRLVGYPEYDAQAVRVIENGEVRTKIQAFFCCGHSFAIVEYTISKLMPELDVQVTLLSNDVNRMYKYSVDTVFDDGEFLGQTAFGTQVLEKDSLEVTFQQWCGLKNGKSGVAVLNNGLYGGSSDGKAIRLSLLR